jgi:hypothetical protein
MPVLRSDADPTADNISNTNTVAADWGPLNAVAHAIADRLANAVVPSAANVGTDARADVGADTGSHSPTDGAADLPSADVGLDSCPNCAADSEPDAATHRVAVMAAHAATDALPDLRVLATLPTAFCEPNALADVLPEPRTNDCDADVLPEPRTNACDADSIAFYCAYATSRHYQANGPADAALAYAGAHLAALDGRADGLRNS